LLLLCRTLLLPFDIYGQSIKFGAKILCQLALFPTQKEFYSAMKSV
jgi:hypothetical protein